MARTAVEGGQTNIRHACLTASTLNSSVYRLLLMDTPAAAVDYGCKVSTKHGAIQSDGAAQATAANSRAQTPDPGPVEIPVMTQ